ncbi:MAG TPA: DUF1566 domain-containing protein [bacterium]|nr:DUF1566 domain-containing protein [bacterium]
MTKYLLLLAALMLTVACAEDDGNFYAGLEWTPLSEESMGWEPAMEYCEAMGARLPNINELRKIIINCPGSTYGGACPAFHLDCLEIDCETADCFCDGGAATYSALGDGKTMGLWSSSSRSDYDTFAWYVGFGNGGVSTIVKGAHVHVRCVR